MFPTNVTLTSLNVCLCRNLTDGFFYRQPWAKQTATQACAGKYAGDRNSNPTQGGEIYFIFPGKRRILFTVCDLKTPVPCLKHCTNMSPQPLRHLRSSLGFLLTAQRRRLQVGVHGRRGGVDRIPGARKQQFHVGVGKDIKWKLKPQRLVDQRNK